MVDHSQQMVLSMLRSCYAYTPLFSVTRTCSQQAVGIVRQSVGMRAAFATSAHCWRTARFAEQLQLYMIADNNGNGGSSWVYSGSGCQTEWLEYKRVPMWPGLFTLRMCRWGHQHVASREQPHRRHTVAMCSWCCGSDDVLHHTSTVSSDGPACGSAACTAACCVRHTVVAMKARQGHCTSVQWVSYSLSLQTCKSGALSTGLDISWQIP
jgi:hypothetical protein